MNLMHLHPGKPCLSTLRPKAISRASEMDQSGYEKSDPQT